MSENIITPTTSAIRNESENVCCQISEPPPESNYYISSQNIASCSLNCKDSNNYNVSNDQRNKILNEQTETKQMNMDVIITPIGESISFENYITLPAQRNETKQSFGQNEHESYGTGFEYIGASKFLNYNNSANSELESFESINANYSTIARNRRRCMVKSKEPKHLLNKAENDSAMSHESEIFICPDCGEEYDQCLLLLRHVQLVHEDPQFHICNICDKQFSTKNILRRHMCGVHLEKVSIRK
ncbi:hypothetical protein B4U80_14354 [Leptotrombidium deliense]|uniref:C2H2-type domain-containing protein n=1 Tax=Leptotrombidium deliense TaxID=299467 RepID=A0A443RXL5_9ACAR|nr:hypothetical protein B4U80_14354 [Leptotrombidium deliense]